MVDLGGDVLISKIRITNTVSSWPWLNYFTLFPPSSSLLAPITPLTPLSLPSLPPFPLPNVLPSLPPPPLLPQFEWILAKAWGGVFIDPFTVTLTDSYGNQVCTLLAV